MTMNSGTEQPALPQTVSITALYGNDGTPGTMNDARHEAHRTTDTTKNNNKVSKVIINNYEEFAALLGKNIGTSDYVELTQDRINMFADATLDHQWIHTDQERAKTESPFKTTIAHGYLTLSMLPHMWNQIIEVNNLKMMVNYGMDRMKFGQAVKSGESIRLVADLHSIENLRGTVKAEIKFSIEIKDSSKKALTGIATFLYYFDKAKE